MYTVEFEDDEICITILDDYGNHSDLIINSFTDIVYMRQFDEETGIENCIELSPDMWEELITAIHSPQGAFRTVKRPL
jgi:hypothetical protein